MNLWWIFDWSLINALSEKRKHKTPRIGIFRIFTKTIPCSPSNSSAHYSNHSYTTCRYNAPQCTSKKHPNMIRTYPDRKKAKFPQNKEIITDRTQILTPAPRPKVIAGHPPTPRHATATTPTPQPNTMDVPRPHECVESETEPTQTEKQQIFRKTRKWRPTTPQILIPAPIFAFFTRLDISLSPGRENSKEFTLF